MMHYQEKEEVAKRKEKKKKKSYHESYNLLPTLYLLPIPTKMTLPNRLTDGKHYIPPPSHTTVTFETCGPL